MRNNKIDVKVFSEARNITLNWYEDEAILCSTDIVLDVLDKSNAVKCPGLYCFYDESGAPLYLGKSIDIKGRIKSHLGGCNAPTVNILNNLKYVKVLFVSKYRRFKLYSIEDLFIRDVKPLFNGGSKGGTFSKYSFHNLREWLNTHLKVNSDGIASAGMRTLEKEVVDTVVKEFLDDSDDDHVHTDISKAITDSNVILNIIDEKPILPYEKVKKEEEATIKNDDSTNSNVDLKRNIIKMLLKEFPESSKLDIAIDSIINL